MYKVELFFGDQLQRTYTYRKEKVAERKRIDLANKFKGVRNDVKIVVSCQN